MESNRSESILLVFQRLKAISHKYRLGDLALNLISSVQFSCSVMSDSLQPDGLQHTRPPCPSPTPRVYSNSCPMSQ